LKIVHISNSDLGGAARACIRLHIGLLNEGVDSNLLLLYKTDYSIPKSYTFMPSEASMIEKFKTRAGRYLKKKKYQKYLKNRPEGLEIFTFPDTYYYIHKHALYKEADAINLHWTAGFLDYASFFRNNKKKVLWTLHDMNSFTGGCHYSGTCKKFQEDCSNCPQLQGTINPNYSSHIFNIKYKAITGQKNLEIVAPSKWLLQTSQSSKLFCSLPHHHIPYGLDSDIFQPRDRVYSRRLLSLPEDKKIVLFVADSLSNKRKGFQYLINALSQIDRDDIILCAIGESNRIAEQINNKLYELGKINDERLMSVAYSAADIFIIPSLEDNLPNTVLEALMCGTPVIGFSAGGIPDMIKHEVNGFLSDINLVSLRSLIDKYLTGNFEFDKNQIRGDSLQNYDLKIQANNYIKLYKKILNIP